MQNPADLDGEGGWETKVQKALAAYVSPAPKGLTQMATDMLVPAQANMHHAMFMCLFMEPYCVILC